MSKFQSLYFLCSFESVLKRIFEYFLDLWTFSESEYYSNIRIFWSEYSEIIWLKNTWIFEKQRQNLDNILWARSRSVVFIDESQHVENSFRLKGVFGVHKNFGFQNLYIFYKFIRTYSNIWIFSGIRIIFEYFLDERIIFDIRFVQFSSDE